MMRLGLLPGACLIAALMSCGIADRAGHEREILAWRESRVEKLRAPYGWLSLVGLYWLREGENKFGSAPDNSLVLPPTSGVEHAGSLWLAEGRVLAEAAEGSGLTADGEPVTSMRLHTDVEGTPTELALGSVRLHIIEREHKQAVRVKDSQAQTRTEFKGIEYYPIDSSWRVKARFEPYDPPKVLPIVNVLGMPEPHESPGALVFEVDGETFRLDPIREDDELFVVFGDATNGSETYGAGRFVYTDLPSEDGTVVLDFNKSYNPPCVFTPYSTCPLPPRQNKLPFALSAGEKIYK